MSLTRSKFRNVFPTAAKNDGQFRDIKVANTIWDCSNFIAANSKYFAVAWAAGGGGKLAILDLQNPCKVPFDTPCLTGHAGPILDWEFHPFADNLIATCSEDCTLKVWCIPQGGLTENMDSPLITLSGHSKKVGILHFHHGAMNVLASAGMDHVMKLWDVEIGEKVTLDIHKDQIFSFAFNLEGNQVATTCRDKTVRIIDVRSNIVAAEGKGHLGNKTQRAVWAKRQDHIITTGFGRSQERQVFTWDPRKMDQKLGEIDLDNASGVLMAFVDEDTNMLYLGGKGDGNLRYYEIDAVAPVISPLSEMSGNVPQRGLCLLPKIACDTTVCEVARILRLESDKVVPISLQCPRKQAATEFQADVYPDTFSTTPVMSAAEYFSGQTLPPNLMKMEHTTGSTAAGTTTAVELKISSAAPVSRSEVEAQRNKVAKLKEQLEAEEAKLKEMEAQFGQL
eukprot:GGOE01036447.1.p1 GENE.GGOE01036447.1~~GGOE01036447.1.p1  ORF type:complete len:451 (-),score=92.81 GGOE01036447.1:220-1572(-)